MIFRFILLIILLSILIIFVDIIEPTISQKYLLHKHKKIKKQQQKIFKKKMDELEIK